MTGTQPSAGRIASHILGVEGKRGKLSSTTRTSLGSGPTGEDVPIVILTERMLGTGTARSAFITALQTTENPLVSINADSGATSSQINPAGA
jgi:hypothetical protein